jgi:2-methylcitrate dehydratase PrpD
VTGNFDVLDGPVGFAAATSEDTGKWQMALATLGKSFAIGEITFKNHGCCGHIFAALDGLRYLQREAGFSPADIARVHVGGYGATKEVCDRPVVATEQEARFSVQYCVAILLKLGGVRLDAYLPEHLTDPNVRAMMERVSVELDPELANVYPRRRPARISVTLYDGRVLERFQPTRIGDPDAPLSDTDLSEKFLELAGPVIGGVPAKALLDSLWRGNDLPGAVALVRQ